MLKLSTVRLLATSTHRRMQVITQILKNFALDSDALKVQNTAASLLDEACLLNPKLVESFEKRICVCEKNIPEAAIPEKIKVISIWRLNALCGWSRK